MLPLALYERGRITPSACLRQQTTGVGSAAPPRADGGRPAGERPRVAARLTLPAAELVRIAIVMLRAETDLLEQLVDTRALRSAARETVDLDALGDDRADAHTRVQRRVRVLKDDLHL